MKRLAFTLLMATAIAARAQDEPANPPERKHGPRPPMTDEQRAQAEVRINDAWNKLPLEAKQRVMRLHHALTQLPPEERKFINDRVKRFLDMSPEEKQRLKENAERWRSMSLEERQKARDEFRQQRRQFEQKWREEHPGEEPPPFLPRPGRPAAPPPPPTEDSQPKSENTTKETP